jgi:hypothetical protein
MPYDQRLHKRDDSKIRKDANTLGIRPHLGPINHAPAGPLFNCDFGGIAKGVQIAIANWTNGENCNHAQSDCRHRDLTHRESYTV